MRAALYARVSDRLGRNLRHFLLTLDELAHLGVTLISLREQFELLSPIGRLVAGFLAGVAEFERALIRDRIQAGVRRAQESGDPVRPAGSSTGTRSPSSGRRASACGPSPGAWASPGGPWGGF